MGDVGFQYSVRKLDFKNNYRKDVPVRSLAGASFYVGVGWILCGEVWGGVWSFALGFMWFSH